MNRQNEYKYDVFISYSHTDQEWVWNELWPRLEQVGTKVIIDCRDFEPGVPLVTEVERAVMTSRKMVLVLTPAYLNSAWTELENILVQTLDPGARQRRLLPVVLQPCEIPLRIRALIYVDLCQPQLYDIQFQRLLEAIADDVPTYSRNDEPPSVYIPAGPFLMGSASDDPDAHDNEKPRRQVDLPAYEIGRYPVTNAQYACFLADDPHYPVPCSEKERDRLYDWDPQARIYPEGKADHPVVLVSWEDATAYCDWLSQITGKHCRLPTEEEWEKAARGGLPETRLYPWGDDWESGFCNTQELRQNGTTSIHKFESVNKSPFGVIDMVGNVWEWTASWYVPYPNSPHETERYGHICRITRGGSWRNSRRGARVPCRGRCKPDIRCAHLGFRIASDTVNTVSDETASEQMGSRAKPCGATSPDMVNPLVFEPETSRQMVNRMKLRELISTYFDEEELRTLCFDLRVNYDDLRGEGRASKARELVAYLLRRGRILELVAYCRQKRPKICWTD
jgi:formylglycine-generating enzyme required for sulfatase activity